jgi:predicted transcriptional regulator
MVDRRRRKDDNGVKAMTTADLTREELVLLYWGEPPMTITEIAERYGVTPAAIWGRMNRYGIPRRKPGPTGKGSLDETAIRQIRKRLRRGESGEAIASDYGVTRQTISLIKTKKLWGHVR